MVTSVSEIPHGWMMVEADATNLVQTRNHHKVQFKQNEGYNLTFFAFFVKAVAESLKANPLLNSTWQGDEIVIHKDINISIAVQMMINCMCQSLKMQMKSQLKVLHVKLMI